MACEPSTGNFPAPNASVLSTETRLKAFSELGRRLCSARTQREAIQIILDTADLFFGWDACTFDSYSAATDLVRPVIIVDRVEGIRRDVASVVKDSRPTPRIRQVIQQGPLLVLRQEPIVMPPDAVPMGDLNRPSASLMYVPVQFSGTVIGVLSIQSYRVDAYTDADLKMLEALADHGAGALERIQAEEQVRELNSVLEARIEERTAVLKATVQELEAFSYGVSHDMRAPLRAMQGYARKLLEDYTDRNLDETAVMYLSRISRAALRLDALIQDVLTYAKVIRSEAPMSAIDIERLLTDLREVYPEWNPPHSTIEISAPLPKVWGNEALLTQCLSNLVSNGIKFVAPGQQPRVHIYAEAKDNAVRIFFQDNGIGIDESDYGRVFRMFERIHPAAEFSGTGIGLTIVKKAVERMHGEVGFTSGSGQGCNFWIQLRKAEFE